MEIDQKQKNMNDTANIQNTSYHSAIANQSWILNQNPNFNNSIHTSHIKFAIIWMFFSAVSKNTNIEYVESALILQTRIPAILSLRPHCDPKIWKLP